VKHTDDGMKKRHRKRNVATRITKCWKAVGLYNTLFCVIPFGTDYLLTYLHHGAESFLRS